MTSNDGSATKVVGDPIISFIDDVITVVVDKAPTAAKSYYLKATTNGGVSVFKEIKVKRTEDPCIYKVNPASKTIVKNYV